MSRLVTCVLLALCVASLSTVAFARSAPVPKLNLTLYEESLCPDCQSLILDQLSTGISAHGLLSYVHLEVVPYGNARRSASSITCQHGPNECLGNAVEQCALYMLGVDPNGGQNSDVAPAWPFLDCLEAQLRQQESQVDVAKATNACAASVKLDPAKILACAQSDKASELQLIAARRTEILSPAHKYVPWVVVDGQHADDCETDVLKCVCSRYKGPTPAFC
eukprot:ANDGO_07384.mRNA.1 GILT-like protein F37H8.5